MDNKKQIKVLLVSPYSDNLVGGIINWTKYIINYHREHVGDIYLSLLYNKNASQVLDTAKPISRLCAGFSNYLPILRQFRKEVKCRRYDVAHICTSASFGLVRDLLIIKEAKKKGLRTVIHMHFGRIPHILASKGWEKMLLLHLMKDVDMAVVMDHASLTALQAKGFNKIRFVPNPLSSEVHNIIERSEWAQRDTQKIVYAGHVIPTKGVEELVRACRGLDKIKLELLGKVPDEAYRNHLFDIAGVASAQWLTIPGNKPFNDVIEEMMSCGVFVLPSYSEGFPNVILESMACGCPIVATTVGAIPEMLDSKSKEPCGLCCEPKDVDSLHQKIKYFLDYPSEAIEYGKRAKKRVEENYAIEKVWAQLVRVWTDVLKEIDYNKQAY